MKRPFCWHQNFVPKGLSAPALATLVGAIHMYKIIKNVHKIRLQRDVFKLATNGQSEKAFLLISKLCAQRVVCPCPEAIYIYKIIKNVYKIDFKQMFLNLQQMVKRPFCWHQNFVPKGLSAPALGLYTCMKSLKMCIKSDFMEILLKLATR